MSSDGLKRVENGLRRGGNLPAGGEFERREGLKRVEKGCFNPRKSRGVRVEKGCIPLGIQPFNPPGCADVQDDLFRGRFEYMPAGPTIATETWIARRLRRPDLFAGVTTADERRERVRRVIVDGQLEEAIAGKRRDASCESWAEVFARVYHQPIERGEDAS